MDNANASIAALFAGQDGQTAGQSGDTKVMSWEAVQQLGADINLEMGSIATSTLLEASPCVFRIEDATIRDAVQTSGGNWLPRAVAFKTTILVHINTKAELNRAYSQTFYIRNKNTGDVSEYQYSQMNKFLFTAIAANQGTTLSEVEASIKQMSESLNAEDRAKVDLSQLLEMAKGGMLAAELQVRTQEGREPQNQISTSGAAPVSEDLYTQVLATLNPEEAPAAETAQSPETAAAGGETTAS